MKNDIRKISVVMCTYNGECYLEEQLNSILCQNYPIYEIIITDDCSSDHTWDILLKYQQRYPNLLFCERNTRNLGYHINFIGSLRKASGDFIAISDQDDIWHLDKLEVMANNVGDKLLLISNSEIIDVNKTSIGKLYDKLDIADFLLEKLIWENHVYGHACMINRKVVDLIDSSIEPSSHDYTIALICSSLESIAVIDKELQKWRRHSEASTWQYQTVNIEYKKKLSGTSKMILAVWGLITGNKSEIIKRGFLKIEGILNSVSNEKEVIVHIEEIKKIAILMSKQTFFSYIKATYQCWKLRDEMFGYHEKIEIKERIAVFTFVFRWWYDHQSSMS